MDQPSNLWEKIITIIVWRDGGGGHNSFLMSHTMFSRGGGSEGGLWLKKYYTLFLMTQHTYAMTPYIDNHFNLVLCFAM